MQTQSGAAEVQGRSLPFSDANPQPQPELTSEDNNANTTLFAPRKVQGQERILD